jgi:hypothetical protein
MNCDASIQACQHCGKMHTNFLFMGDKLHLYGPWERSPGSSRELRRCRDCGHIERNF